MPSDARNQLLARLSGAVGGTLARQVVGLALALVQVALLARLLGPAGNGDLNLALVFGTLLVTSFNLGLPAANCYFIARGALSLDQALRTNLGLGLGLAAGTGVLGAIALASPLAAYFHVTDPTPFWLVLALVYPLQLLVTLATSVLQGGLAFGRANQALLVGSVATLALTVLFVWILAWGIPGALGAAAGGQLLALAVAVIAIRRHPDRHAGPEAFVPRRYLRESLAYAFQVHVSNVVTYLNYRIDFLMVAYFCGPLQAGIYAVSLQIAERLWLLSQASSSVILPLLSSLGEQESLRRDVTPLVARWIAALTLVGAGAIAAIGWPLLLLCFGPQYRAAYVPLLLLLPGIYCVSQSRVLANDLAARGRADLNVWTAVILLVAGLVANLLLVPTMGVWGAAGASSVAYAIDAMTKNLLYSRTSGNSWQTSLLLTREDARIAYALAAPIIKNRVTKARIEQEHLS